LVAGIEAVIKRQQNALSSAATIASSSADSMVERACFGSVGTSVTEVRRFRLTLVS
jgi:hypothetical protein